MCHNIQATGEAHLKFYWNWIKMHRDKWSQKKSSYFLFNALPKSKRYTSSCLASSSLLNLCLGQPIKSIYFIPHLCVNLLKIITVPLRCRVWRQIWIFSHWVVWSPFERQGTLTQSPLFAPSWLQSGEKGSLDSLWAAKRVAWGRFFEPRQWEAEALFWALENFITPFWPLLPWQLCSRTKGRYYLWTFSWLLLEIVMLGCQRLLRAAMPARM